jgi:hypothetical protein
LIFIDSNIPMNLAGAALPADAQLILEGLVAAKERLVRAMPKFFKRFCIAMPRSSVGRQSDPHSAPSILRSSSGMESRGFSASMAITIAGQG